jgi:hypothetical protein
LVRLLFLRLVQPASAYVQREQRRAWRDVQAAEADWAQESERDSRGAPDTPAQGADGKASDSIGQDDLLELRQAYADELRVAAEKLATDRRTTIQIEGQALQAVLVRFWTRSAILDARLVGSDGFHQRTYTLIDRGELARDPAPRLADHLLTAFTNLS